MLSPATPLLAQLFAQVNEQQIARACGDPPGAVCALVYRATEQVWLASFLGEFLPNLLRVVLIVAVAWIANRVLRRLIKRFTRSLAGDGLQVLGKLRGVAPLADTSPLDLSRVAMRTETIGSVLYSIASFVVWATAVVMILGTFGVNLGPLLAGAGIVGIALGFGAQNLVKDFLAGIFIILEDQYGIGDVVDLRDSIGSVGAGGAVEGISLRTTRLRDVEGTLWHVPNGEIRTSGNKSQQWARSLLDVGIPYSADVNMATDVLKRVADELWRDAEYGKYIIEEPEVWGVERFEAFQLVLRMVLKVQPAKQWSVNRELRARIKRAFDSHGIDIQVPQPTIMARPSGIENASPADQDLAAPASPKSGS